MTAFLGEWRGQEACHLQAALRLSNEAFAGRLGIAVRTVAAWHDKPDRVPRPEMQQILDIALEQAGPGARQRFERAIGAAADTGGAASTAAVTRATTAVATADFRSGAPRSAGSGSSGAAADVAGLLGSAGSAASAGPDGPALPEASASWQREQAPSGPQLLRVAIAVVVRAREVLLVCRRAEEARSIGWQFPAGVVKPGARAETVAVRETLAETGVRCRVQRALGGRVHPVTGVLCDYLLCEYLAGEAVNADVAENADVVWAPWGELTRFIPVETIFVPVIDALKGVGDAR